MFTITNLKWSARLVSGLIGFIFPALFAWDIYSNHLVQNLATWFMIFILDLLGLILVIKSGNDDPKLQWGWLLASVCILSAILGNESKWHWGWTETVSLACCGGAIWMWLTRNDPKRALWFYLLAMYISFTPQAIDYWVTPQPQTLYLWISSIASCVLAIAGSEKHNLANTLVPYGAGVLNALIAVLVLL